MGGKKKNNPKNQSIAYHTIHRENFVLGMVEKEVRKHSEWLNFPSLGWDTQALNQSNVFSSPNNTIAYLKIAPAEFTWAYHTNGQALSCCSLITLWNWVKFPFLMQRMQWTCPVGEPKRKFLWQIYWPLSVLWILSDLLHNHTFYSVSSDVSYHKKQQWQQLTAISFWLFKNACPFCDTDLFWRAGS